MSKAPKYRSMEERVYRVSLTVAAIIAFAILLFGAAKCKAQEIGVSVGVMDALTDIGGNRGVGGRFIKDIERRQAHGCFTLSLQKSFSNVSLGVAYTHGTLSGDDSIQNYGGAERYRIQRGYRFFTPLDELTITAKKYFGEGLRPFLFGGAGLFRYRDKVDRMQPCLLYGGGLNYTLNENVQIESIAAARNTFTDRLDGVSEKPYSKGNDSYLSLSFGIILTGLFRKDILRCYKF